MGARTNFHFKTNTGDLTLYSHWGGESKMQDLAFALNKAMPRLSMGDTSYGLRIAVSNLIGPDWDSQTGYGLFVGEEGGEEEYAPVTVDLTNNTVIHNGSSHTIESFINYYLGANV